MILLAACAAEAPPPVPEGAIPAGQVIGSASISGRAILDGQPPPPEEISMDSDSACAARGGTLRREDVVTGAEGGLANVFVRVSSGLGARVFAPPASPVILNQRGCRYEPHVAGLQVGQALEIVNSDPTLHNIHSLPAANAPFNVAMPSEGMRIRKYFTAPEVMVRVKCDLHNWMEAWIGVTADPFHDVTSPSGAFMMAGLPAGTYEVEAWHEVYGIQKMTVTLGDGERGSVDFVFRP